MWHLLCFSLVCVRSAVAWGVLASAVFLCGIGCIALDKVGVSGGICSSIGGGLVWYYGGNLIVSGGVETLGEGC